MLAPTSCRSGNPAQHPLINKMEIQTSIDVFPVSVRRRTMSMCWPVEKSEATCSTNKGFFSRVPADGTPIS
jgi:hypothetical protein